MRPKSRPSAPGGLEGFQLSPGISRERSGPAIRLAALFHGRQDETEAHGIEENLGAVADCSRIQKGRSTDMTSAPMVCPPLAPHLPHPSFGSGGSKAVKGS